MQAKDWVTLSADVAALIVGKVAPRVAPIVAQGVAFAEHAVDASGAPLTGAQKKQLASEAVAVGVGALNTALVAKGKDPVVFQEDDQVGDLIDDVVDTTNAVKTALDASATKLAQNSDLVTLLPSQADVVARKVATAQPKQGAMLR